MLINITLSKIVWKLPAWLSELYLTSMNYVRLSYEMSMISDSDMHIIHDI